jgi:hypothetical protein
MKERARAVEEMNRLRIQIRDEGEGGDDSPRLLFGAQPIPGLITDPTSDSHRRTLCLREEGCSIRLFLDQSWYNRALVEGSPVGIM